MSTTNSPIDLDAIEAIHLNMRARRVLQTLNVRGEHRAQMTDDQHEAAWEAAAAAHTAHNDAAAWNPASDTRLSEIRSHVAAAESWIAKV